VWLYGEDCACKIAKLPPHSPLPVTATLPSIVAARATRHGERKLWKYNQGELSLSQINSALQGVSTLLTNIGDVQGPLSAPSSSKTPKRRENGRAPLRDWWTVNTNSRLQQMTRGSALLPSKMTFQRLLGGPNGESCPARVTGIALRSAREPHSGTRNLAACALQGE